MGSGGFECGRGRGGSFCGAAVHDWLRLPHRACEAEPVAARHAGNRVTANSTKVLKAGFEIFKFSNRNDACHVGLEFGQRIQSTLTPASPDHQRTRPIGANCDDCLTLQPLCLRMHRRFIRSSPCRKNVGRPRLATCKRERSTQHAAHAVGLVWHPRTCTRRHPGSRCTGGLHLSCCASP